VPPARPRVARVAAWTSPLATSARKCHGSDRRFADDPEWRHLVLFYEYFHGEDGRGCGASHQTGWTALVTHCLESLAARGRDRTTADRRGGSIVPG
jgi:hypothetical protein